MAVSGTHRRTSSGASPATAIPRSRSRADTALPTRPWPMTSIRSNTQSSSSVADTGHGECTVRAFSRAPSGNGKRTMATSDATVEKEGRVGRIRPFDESGITRGADGVLRYDRQAPSLVALLREAVDAAPNEEALVEVGGWRLTYGELWERAARVAGGLRQRDRLVPRVRRHRHGRRRDGPDQHALRRAGGRVR